MIRPGDFPIQSAHFVERHGLILLIALGESVVAVGIGLAGVDLPPGRILAAMLGLALAAAFWWLYFTGDDDAAEQSLERAAGKGRAWLALYAFGYDFLLILCGIIIVAAGLKLAVVRYDQPLLASTAWFLAAGVAIYALGLALFRWILRSGSPAIRLLIAGLALPTAIVGLTISPTAQLGTLVAFLIAGPIAELWEKRAAARGSTSEGPGRAGS